MLINFSSVLCFPETYISNDDIEIQREINKIDETSKQIIEYGRRIINATLSEP